MNGQAPTPYLSIVVASRNDNHGGDMLKRMRVFTKALIYQCDKYRLSCELILVEWNPIKDKPFLNEVLPKPGPGSYLTIRYIEVPPEIHARHAFSEQIPLFQMIAKNVGIRRAKAEFILCTNIDIIFSDRLFEALAKQDLKQDCFYRANRCDVPNTLDENWTVEQQLEYCSKHILKRLGKNSHYANFSDTTGLLFKIPQALWLLKTLSKIKSWYANKPADRLTEIDTDACGDFTLMSRKNWLQIEGYPELEIYSIHIDSLGILAAAALGIKQVIFEAEKCTFHMEHNDGWEFKTPIDRLHFYTKKPMLEWWSVKEAGLYIIERSRGFELNRPNWGLLDEKLTERSA